MAENIDDLRQESRNLLIFIWRKRLIIGMVTFLAVAASVVTSLMMTPEYRSTAIVFPAATSTVSFSEQRQAKASSMDFGEEEQAEQLLQILQSSRIRNKIVAQFDLFNHYEIDSKDPNKNYKLTREYEGHFQFTRTRYGSITIDVWDRDSVLAMQMANKVVQLIDTVKNAMVQERTWPAFEINKRKKQMLEDEQKTIIAEMDSLSQLGVVSVEARANLYSAYNQSKNPADRAFFKEQIDMNLKYGAKFDGLEMLRDEKIVKLTKFEDSYEQSESDANTLFNHKFVVEDAVVADKKDKPRRMLTVFLATVGAFFFIVFALLVKERFAEIRKMA